MRKQAFGFSGISVILVIVILGFTLIITGCSGSGPGPTAGATGSSSSSSGGSSGGSGKVWTVTYRGGTFANAHVIPAPKNSLERVLHFVDNWCRTTIVTVAYAAGNNNLQKVAVDGIDAVGVGKGPIAFLKNGQWKEKDIGVSDKTLYSVNPLGVKAGKKRYFAAGGDGSPVGINFSVEDGGTTSVVNGGLATNHFYCSQASSNDPDKIAIGGEQGPAFSTDGGTTITVYPGDGKFNSVCFWDSNWIFFVGTTDSSLWVFNRANLTGHVRKVVIADISHAMVRDENKLYLSGKGFGASSGKLWRLTFNNSDVGVWNITMTDLTPLIPPLTDGQFLWIFSLSCESPGKLTATGAFGKIYSIVENIDGTTTITEQSAEVGGNAQVTGADVSSPTLKLAVTGADETILVRSP